MWASVTNMLGPAAASVPSWLPLLHSSSSRSSREGEAPRGGFMHKMPAEGDNCNDSDSKPGMLARWSEKLRPFAQRQEKMEHGTQVYGVASGWLTDRVHEPWLKELQEHGSNNSEALESFRDLIGKRPNAPIPSVRGFAFEIEQARSFNEDAISKGSPFRADWLGASSHSASDIDIRNIHTGETVASVQCKASDDYKWVQKQLGDPKYEKMLKVTTEGTADKVPGARDRIEFGGVSSSPEAVDELDERVGAARGGDFDSSTAKLPSLMLGERLWQAGQAGMAGAAVGAGLGAISSGAAAYWRGDDTDKVQEKAINAAIEGAVVGGVSSCAAAVATDSLGDACGVAVGGVVAAAVRLPFQLERCEGDSACRAATTGSAIGGATGALIGQTLIPVPVVGGMVGGMLGRAVGGEVAGEVAK